MARCVIHNDLIDCAAQGGVPKAMFLNTYNDLTDLTDLFRSYREAQGVHDHRGASGRSLKKVVQVVQVGIPRWSKANLIPTLNLRPFGSVWKPRRSVMPQSQKRHPRPRPYGRVPSGY
jgi:hypothetical protein